MVGDDQALASDLDRLSAAVAAVVPTTCAQTRWQALAPLLVALAIGLALGGLGLWVALAITHSLAQPPVLASSNSSSAGGVLDNSLYLSSLISLMLYLFAGVIGGSVTGRASGGVWAATLGQAIGSILGGACLSVAVYAGGTHIPGNPPTVQGQGANTTIFLEILAFPIGLALSALLGWLGGSVGVGSRALLRLAVTPPRATRRQSHTGTILIARRPEDAAVVATMHGELAKFFGARAVRDSDEIGRGADPRSVAVATLTHTAALVVPVGPRWLENPDGGDSSRLDYPADPIRSWLEAAQETGTPISPAYLEDAIPPTTHRIPPSIREFALLNGTRVRAGSDFIGDMARLRAAILYTTRLQASPVRRMTRRLVSVILWIACVIVGFAAVAISGNAFSSFVRSTLDAPASELAPGDAVTQFMTYFLFFVLIHSVVYFGAGAILGRWSGRLGGGISSALVISLLGSLFTTILFLVVGIDHKALFSPDSPPPQGGVQVTVVALSFILFIGMIPSALTGGAALGWLGAAVGRARHARAERRALNRELRQGVAFYAGVSRVE